MPIGALAAYALSRIPRRGSGPILSALLTIRMFPHMPLAIPFFVMGSFLGLIDTYPLLILALVAINQPVTIWPLYGLFLDIPRDLDEAAAIDGCNSWQAFRIVTLPLARPRSGARWRRRNDSRSRPRSRSTCPSRCMP